MIAKRIAGLAVSLSMASAFGTPIEAMDLSGWTNVAAEPVQMANLLPDGGFEQGAAGWSHVDGEKILVDRGGINQTGALRYSREDDSYTLVMREVELKPGTCYRFGAMVRTKDVTGEGAGLYMEGYSAGNKYAAGAYSRPVSGTQDWVLVEADFTTPREGDCHYIIGLYLRKNSTGTAWYDDVFVREQAPLWQLELVYPTHHTVYDGQAMQFYSRIEGADPEQTACEKLLLQIDGAPQAELYGVDAPRLAIRPPAGPDGNLTVRGYWLNPERREILAEKTFTVRRAARPELPDNAAMVDEEYRLIVDGKPYLPIGLYTQQLTREDIDLISDSPFNCVMPYPSPNLTFGEEERADLATITEVLDYCDDRDVKVIFSLKDMYDRYKLSWRPELTAEEDALLLVKKLKAHPALLAWYICDEAAVEKVPEIAARRRLVNELDPFHPTWSVYYQVKDFQCYVPAQDIFGNDPYPINFRDDKHILGVDNSTRKAESLQMPLWSVPQIHHTGFYNSDWRQDPGDYFEKLRPPTETETLAMSLLEAMRGAKGFVMYSYFDLHWGPDKLQFERRWPEVCRVAGTLRKLEPFLLSTAAAPDVKVEAAKGEVYAKAFADGEGGLRVLVMSPGPGEVDAELVVEGVSGLLSERGRTYEKAPGRYRFTGLNTCCDILRLDPPPAQ